MGKMLRYVLFTLCTILLLEPLSAQQLIGDSLTRKSAFKVKRMAKQSLRYNDTYSAIELYELYIKKRPKKIGAQFELAQLRQQTRDYATALDLYSQVTNTEPDLFPKAWFYKGQCEKHLQKYIEAEVSFEEFKDRYRGLKDKSKFRRLIKAEMAGIVIADSLWNNKLPVLVKPMKELNQKHTESSPIFISDSLMYFSAMADDILPIIGYDDSVSAIPRMKIFESKLVNGEWSAPTLLESEINDQDYHITNPVIGPKGKYLYYSVCAENWQGKIVCRIFQSRLVNDVWKRPEEMGFGINESGFTSTQAAVAVEPKRKRTILYFVSDRPGGKGGKDIYFTRYNVRNEEWSKPRNCGSKLNTVGNEETPWFDKSRGTMYFSSDGHPGIGGMDVFSSVGMMSKWSIPKISGVPINSAADDIYFKKQPRERYQVIVSNRPGSLSLWNTTCCDDIYEVFYPSNIDMIIKVTGFETSADIEKLEDRRPVKEGTTNIYLLDPESGERYLIQTDSMNGGKLELSLEPGSIYQIEIEKPGYFSATSIVDTRKNNINDTASAELTIKKWDEKPIIIPNIYFDFGSADLTSESRNTVDTTIFKLLTENPTIIVVISAHTDSKGSSALNKKLSQRRAESITKYLIQKGIDKERLSGVGYGESKPIAPNENPDGTDNPDGRAKNRRVDFSVTGTKLDIISSD